MKNIFNIALIATLAIAVSVAAQKAPVAFAADTAADTAAVAAQEAFQVPEDQPVTPTSTSQDQDVNENEGDNDDQSAQWGKKHHHQKHHHKHHKHHHHKHGKDGKHGKHGQHGKHGKKDRCCIKYVTVTSVPECKPEPTKCPPKIEAAGTADGATAGGDAAPIAHEAAAIMEAWNPAPPAPAW